MKKINLKSLQFKAVFEAVGCVNFDDASQQKFEVGASGKKFLGGKIYDNVSFAKKTYFKENGVDSFLYKVSSEAIRHAIFVDSMPYLNTTVTQIPQVFYNALAMPALISRGYMFTTKNSLALKRKSPLTITDAIEIGEKRTQICLDFHSRTGEKNTAVKDENSAKDTTIYNIENVGHNLYQSIGCIDLQELQFISADPTYDRMGVDADGGVNEQIYLNALHRNFPTFNGGFDYYYIDNTMYADEWAERGILLDTESVNMMVKQILKAIMQVNITRRNAWFGFKSLEVSFDNGKTFENINLDNLDDLEFDVISKYKQADEQRIIENRKKVEEIKEKNKEKSDKNKGKSQKKDSEQ